MKSLYSIAVKCNRIIDKSIHCNTNFISRHLTSKAKPRKSRKNENSTIPAETLKAMKAACIKSYTKSLDNLYVIDAEVAKRIAVSIMAHHSVRTPLVMEMNPGLGILTKELLTAGINKIRMFEEIEYFWPRLTECRQQYPNRLQLQRVNFNNVLDVAYKDWKNGTNNLDDFFFDVGKRSWNHKETLEIIGSRANTRFIFHLVRSLLFQKTLRQWGRMTFYLCVPPSVSNQLNCTNEHYAIYRTPVVLFRTLFCCKVLEVLPRSAFYPKYIKPKAWYYECIRELHAVDNADMHLVKIEAKRNLFDGDFKEQDLLAYYYFVSHHFKARGSRVIPALENWVPGCGPALIEEGFNIFTEFGDLLPPEVLNLYIKFKSLPGYRQSSFTSCVSAFFNNIEEHISFNENTENIDEIFQESVQKFEEEKKQSKK